MRKPPSIVQEFTSDAGDAHQQFKSRSTPRYAKGQPLFLDDVLETIREILWEEVEKSLSLPQPQVDSIANIVRKEVWQSLEISEKPQSQHETIGYAATVHLLYPLRDKVKVLHSRTTIATGHCVPTTFRLLDSAAPRGKLTFGVPLKTTSCATNAGK